MRNNTSFSSTFSTGDTTTTNTKKSERQKGVITIQHNYTSMININHHMQKY